MLIFNFLYISSGIPKRNKSSETEQAKGKVGEKFQFSTVHLILLKGMRFTYA